MAYGDFKNLTRGTASDKVLRDKGVNVAKNPKYDRYQRGLASVVYNFSDEKSSGANASGGAITCANKSTIMSNQKLAEELHKLVIRKFEIRKVYSSFKDNMGC